MKEGRLSRIISDSLRISSGNGVPVLICSMTSSQVCQTNALQPLLSVLLSGNCSSCLWGNMLGYFYYLNRTNHTIRIKFNVVLYIVSLSYYFFYHLLIWPYNLVPLLCEEHGVIYDKVRSFFVYNYIFLIFFLTFFL